MSFQPTYDALTHTHLKAIPFTQRSLAFGSFTASYQALGAALIGVPLVMGIIVSTLDATIQWSWDGVNAAFPVIAGATIIIDFKSDKIILPANFGAYVKNIGTPGDGSIYFGGFSV